MATYTATIRVTVDEEEILEQASVEPKMKPLEYLKAALQECVLLDFDGDNPPGVKAMEIDWETLKEVKASCPKP